MRSSPPLRLLGLAALLCHAAATGLAWRWEEALFPSGPYAQSGSDDDEAGGARASQRLRQTKDAYVAEYSFVNFNRDSIQVSFQEPRSSYAAYCAGFWYSRDQLDAIDAWHNAARQGATKLAVDSGKSKAQIDTAMANLKAERDRRIREYLASRGFQLLPGNVVEADVPLMVKRSSAQLKPLALAFQRIATQNRYDSESLIGSVTAMVQTALLYRIPPVVEGSQRTGGILPPVMSLVRGWGDCDTKTGLLASILTNWPQVRLVGIAVPEHYLMGVLRIPGRGDAYVEYRGQQYVLIEPAGPAWLPPGTVGVDTMPKLQAPEGFRIQPFFDSPG